jgi:hypothetical protein
MPSSEERTRKAIDRALGYRSATRPGDGLEDGGGDEVAA